MEGKIPKLTIATPSYNRFECLHQLYSDISKQDGLEQFEIMLIDDCSTDGSPEMVKKKFKFVRVVRHEKNRGKCAAINTAFKSARTEWVLFVDSDVRMENPKVLIDFLNTLKKEGNELDIVSLNVIDANDPLACDSPPHSPLLPGKPWADCAVFDGNAFAVRKDVWKTTGGFDEDLFLYHEEADFSVRAMAHGFHIACLPAMKMEHHEFGFGKKSSRKDSSYSRNVLWFYWKNMPLRVIITRYFGFGAFGSRLLHGDKKAVMRGLFDGIRGLPRELGKRRPVPYAVAKKFLDYDRLFKVQEKSKMHAKDAYPEFFLEKTGNEKK